MPISQTLLLLASTSRGLARLQIILFSLKKYFHSQVRSIKDAPNNQKTKEGISSTTKPNTSAEDTIVLVPTNNPSCPTKEKGLNF